MIPFDGARAAQTAQEFIDHELVERLGATRVSVGENFRFGNRAQRRRRRCCAPRTRSRRAWWSWSRSTARSSPRRTSAGWSRPAPSPRPRGCSARRSGCAGSSPTATSAGRTLGFPTANLVPDPALAVPDHGIYACRASVPGPGGVDRGGLDRRAPDVRHRPRAAGRGVPARTSTATSTAASCAWSSSSASAASAASTPSTRWSSRCTATSQRRLVS